ncbi:MAG: hypothetical protein ACOZFS_09655 [Thermodesulfobacteriota bacterium]
MIWTIFFIVGFLLFIALFSEESARAWAWLRAGLAQSPRYRIIAYPLIAVLLLAAGIIIVVSLIKLSTTATFSYE